ncbi:MAG TPA: bifunctional 3,4-dihydroxy-2-butanone-4-phosphate synthase/GTP cyclohydrolase II, partial [Candidatus Kerfeldbacteria bacterium]|nr:bifunctional 3,4-dihydroxy-2-butanone-4-phosphate synthase/GTP cyclohydrolase II [Candidatus Kerfeldbacteria bacterium]
MSATTKLASIPAALRDLQHGKPVVVVDDAKRENEGDVQLPAATATARWINFMV